LPQTAHLIFTAELDASGNRSEHRFYAFLKEHSMSGANTIASAAHKEAAAEHTACAEHHTKAASCHDNQKIDDAKASSKSAMSCCVTAGKQSSAACGCSAK
jgi:hypothetical protein